mgnify:CR=1 FL=1
MDIEPDKGMSELMSALDDAPKLEPQETEEVEPVEQEDEVQEAVEPQEEPEPELVDLDGKKLEIPQGTPPELVETVKKMATDLKADYTRKSQANAEAEKQVQAYAQSLAHQQQLMGATAETWADFRTAQKRVEEFSQVDWSALADQDPAQATKLMALYQTAQADAHTKGAAWHQTLQQLNAQSEQHRDSQTSAQWAKAVEVARNAIGSTFDEQANTKALKWLTAKAGTQDVKAIAQRFGDPVVLEAIYKAAQWDAAKAGKPMQRATQAPQKVIKPSAPMPRKENQAALDRLKKTGRAEELIHFLK